jgi:hypothetical protein
MRFLTKLVVLGFAGLGVYKAWEMLGPRVTEARQRAEDARDRLEPAIRDAAETLQTATKEAAETITEGSPDAGEPAPDPFGNAAEMVHRTKSA